MSRFLNVSLAGSILLAGMITPPASAQSRFTQWFCRLLGINPQIYSKVTRVRGGSTVPGIKVASFDLRNSQEQILWKCDGCWSPSLSSDGVLVVIKSDGIWALSTSRPEAPKLRVPIAGLALILGPVSGQANKMLVVQRGTNNAACEFQLRVADLTSGTISEPTDSPQRCVRLAEVLKADRINGNMVIRESSRDSRTGSRTLLKAEIDERSSRPLEFTALLPDRHDNTDRFDAIWLNDHTIAYLTNP